MAEALHNRGYINQGNMEASLQRWCNAIQLTTNENKRNDKNYNFQKRNIDNNDSDHSRYLWTGTVVNGQGAVFNLAVMSGKWQKTSDKHNENGHW